MRRTRKNTLGAMALIGAMAAVIGACSDSGGSGDDEVTISFWTHTHPPMITVYEELIEAYEAENEGVTIDYQTVPNNEFGTRLLTALSSGSGPDIINMDDSALRGDYIPSNLLAPIDPEPFGLGSVEEIEAMYVPGTLEGATGEDGTLYGLPSEFNGTAFAVNTAHLADAGLDADVTLETWDDVVDVGQQLIAAGHTQAFSFLYLHSGWYSQQFQTLIGQTGGSIADGDVGTVDSPEAQEALQLWVDLAGGDRSVADPNVTSREATTPFQDLATGVQSMAIVYPWAMDQIAETNPETYADLTVVPLPQVDPSDPSARVYGYYWAVNQASAEQAQAWRFVQYLSEHSEEFLIGTDFVQPLLGWDETPAALEIPFLDVWSEAYEAGQFDEVTPNYAEVQDALTTMINSAVFDGVPVAEATTTAAETISRILQN